VDADYADCKALAKNERDARDKRVGRLLAEISVKKQHAFTPRVNIHLTGGRP
jgi:hypothetical protein